MDDRPILHYSEIHMHGVSELLSRAANEMGQPAALEMVIAVGIEANSYDEAKTVISRYVRLDNYDNN
jgi:hypothetical protein